MVHRGARCASVCVLECQVRGPRFKPQPGQKFGTRFMLHVHPYSAYIGPQVTGYTRTSSKPGTDLRRGREGQAKGCRYLGHKERHERNPTSQEQKRRPENTKAWGKGEEKSI